MSERQWKLLGLSIAVIGVTLLVRFLYRLYTVRSMFKGLPGPPHHPLWGHLHLMPGIVKLAPRNIAPQCLLQIFKEKYDLGDFFYLDNWPLGPPFLVACDPDISSQFVSQRSMPKSYIIADFTEHISGRQNLVSDDGPRWRTWRSAFNPGFSASHLMTLVPDIVDNVSVFCSIMREKAESNELFRMERYVTRLTEDIIGKIVLDIDFDSQTGENELVSAFESQVQWVRKGAVTNPEELIDFRRPFVFWWNTRKMNRYLAGILEKRFEAHKKGLSKTKYIIDLAMEVYAKEKGSSIEQMQTLDLDFKKAAIDQVKTLVFAGHDTSTSTVSYCWYHLSRNPSALARARKECEEVFGKDPSETAGEIKRDPHLINKLEYMMAVIREALRMYSPVSAVRSGSEDFFVTDPLTNERYPTAGFELVALNACLHYNKKRWSDPYTFKPERWLTKAPAPEGADRDAWAPFSKLPRNCIGQELAVMEIKIILAMILRSFDFKAAFDEVEKLKGDGSGYPSDTTGVQELWGEQAYQIQVGTAKPREGMPCRLSKVVE